MDRKTELQSISTIMLGVRDVEASLAFYQDRLQLPVRMSSPDLAFLDGGNVTLGLSRGLANASASVAGAMEVVFSVSSVREAYNALCERGVKFLREPRQVTPNDWAATLEDPDGHKISIFGPEN